ncbi:hypothetical protein [uncultured Dokdonia sp.]|uniref:hypothetical protein n=1 Tax=uncultured Dokdonia sp. TaxID=575653 RepID=UPI002604F7DD|nr:hypothetical protein [uncultured Dokdonia sp.]
MKNKNLKSLELKKETISSFHLIKVNGGQKTTDQTTVEDIPYFTHLSCDCMPRSFSCVEGICI